jgi:RNA-directed DNA polymerase
VLQPSWDPTFSDASFGFRPGRSAHQAIARAQAYIAEGYACVVDLDLEKFFDRVDQDLLMGLVAKRVGDHRLLRLIRGFLSAGVLAKGLVGPTDEGVPQGGPLSPLLSNLMLDVAIGLCATRTTATSTCAVAGPASGSWRASPVS